MNLNIHNPNINKINEQQKRYGSLIVETSLRQDVGTIDLSQPSKVFNQRSTTVSNAQSSTSTLVNSTSSQTNSSSNLQHKPSIDKSIRSKINTSNSMQLKRGQKLSLNSLTQNLGKLIVALDWDITFNRNIEFDLDTSIFMVDINGKTSEENFIFYGNPKSRDTGIILGGDHNSLLKRGYNTTAQLNLNLIPNNIQKLAFTITIYDAEKRNQHFSYVSNGHFRIIDTQTKTEIINYKFTENLDQETALVAAEIYRHKNEWKVSPIGSGFLGGLKALCDNYGIDTV
ncbi:TerD family protein [Clostridium sp. MB40-C1]|uniref:TerD family protein n=1 Tax=Clostridium sp. MB40-C1 TaxID=3070996 RepID=UPI0027DECB99|nr:TerD family protein [Clostridium sp. MB40-C1]WMJ79915.1 TerD family protein [Clostridium sp. MB40-C1]